MSTSTRSNPYYPPLFAESEDALIRTRRGQPAPAVATPPAVTVETGTPPPSANIAGLALSGGGIRSATFCLGFLQAVAKAGLLERIDYLSTVSGGGYVGSFLGAWISREGNNVKSVQGKLAGLTADEVVYLRENGRYLAPNGSGDAWSAAVMYVRNWAAMLIVVGTLAFGAFMALEALKIALNAHHSWGAERVDSTVFAAFPVAWSPFWKFAQWLFLLGALPAGIAYWLVFPVRSRPPSALLLIVAAVAYLIGALLWKSEWLPESIARQPWPWFAVAVITLDWCWWADRRQRLHLNQPVNGWSRAVGIFAHHVTLWLLVVASAALIYGSLTLSPWIPPVIRESSGRWIILLLALLTNRVAREIVPTIARRLSQLFSNEQPRSAASTSPSDANPSTAPTGTPIESTPPASRIAAAEKRVKRIASTAVDTVHRVSRIDPGDFAAARAALTSWLALWLGWCAIIVLIALVDSAGQTVAESHHALTKWLWTLVSPAALVAFMQSLAPKLLARDGNDGKPSVPLNVLLWIVAVIVALGAAIGLATAARLWTQDLLGVDYLRVFHGDGDWSSFATIGGVAIGLIFVSGVFGQYLQFVNLSGHHQLYASRLTRAYLGASNPARHQSQKNWQVTETVTGDLIEYGAYQPHANGGPLHIINMTVNETMSGLSNIEQRDRKGFSFAIGPAGLSVRRTDHALFPQDAFERIRAANIKPITAPPPYPTAVASAPVAPAGTTPPATQAGSRFHVFSDSTAVDPQRVEMPSLGAWVAMSGAAFTTGLGARTSLAASFLLGLLNVRLGYWWDSRIEPYHRPGVAQRSEMQRLMARLARLFPAHVAFADELFARFHGVDRRHWYLSDGGHFENTACYELLRRRVPFIICCDCGCDPEYLFEDAANLIRKARIDFGIEIRFLEASELESLSEPAKKVIGPLAALRPRANDSEPLKLASAHATIAKIEYSHGAPDGWLLLVKPTLSTSISRDVLHYAVDTPPFPQQTTMDQFFDEAQWESYRQLGFQTGEMLLATKELSSTTAKTGGGWTLDFSPPAPGAAGKGPAAVPDPAQLLKEFIKLVNATNPPPAAPKT